MQDTVPEVHHSQLCARTGSSPTIPSKSLQMQAVVQPVRTQSTAPMVSSKELAPLATGAISELLHRPMLL
jgi:hypothetical protein